jgi:hypothetical protein
MMKMNLLSQALVAVVLFLMVMTTYSAVTNKWGNDAGVTPTPTVTVMPSGTIMVSVTTAATASPTVSVVAITVVPTVDDAALLRAEVLAASGIPQEKFQYSVSVNNGTIARGSVKNSDDTNGAAWFAGKVNNVWRVSYVGQGVPFCSALGSIPYPTTWISHCMSGNNTVAR